MVVVMEKDYSPLFQILSDIVATIHWYRPDFLNYTHMKLVFRNDFLEIFGFFFCFTLIQVSGMMEVIAPEGIYLKHYILHCNIFLDVFTF